MKLPPRFSVTITGSHWRMRERRSIVPNELPHLLAHLLDGNEVSTRALSIYGLSVFVEEDTDQADEDPAMIMLGAGANRPR